MVKSNDNSKQQEFRVVLEPVNDFTTTDDLERKLRLMCGGIGIKVVSAERVDDQEQPCGVRVV